MMMHRFLFWLTSFCVFLGCSEVPIPEQPTTPVTKTLRVFPAKEAGMHFVLQRAQDQGMPIQVRIREIMPREYVVTGPYLVVQKLEHLASGEWLYAKLFPATGEAGRVLSLHIHKMLASGSLAEEDVQSLMTTAEGNGGWMVVGPKEIVERLEKISCPN